MKIRITINITAWHPVNDDSIGVMGITGKYGDRVEFRLSKSDRRAKLITDKSTHTKKKKEAK